MKSKQLPEQYTDKVECLDELHELERQGHIALFFGDEAGFSLNCNPPYGWQFPGEAIRILPQTGQRVNVLGFLKASGDELASFETDGLVQAAFVVDSINEWRRGLSKPTVLVLDNARIHRSKLLESQLAQWQEAGLYIFFLPAYSPHLNRIERLWLKTKQRWLKPGDYQSLDSLKAALKEIWAKFGSQYSITFN